MRESPTKFIKLGALAREFDLPLDTLHLLIKKGELPEPQMVDHGSWGFRRQDILSWDRERTRRG
jgi:predicted DNA-binding transcriptional regulator AlpA